jgi:hypothetical protein
MVPLPGRVGKHVVVARRPEQIRRGFDLACPEGVVHASDLPAARFWVGNALRGLIPVVWAGAPA